MAIITSPKRISFLARFINKKTIGIKTLVKDRIQTSLTAKSTSLHASRTALRKKLLLYVTILYFCVAGTSVHVIMPQTWVIIGGSVLLPNVGGWIGGFITRSNIKDWFEKGK